MFLNSLGGHVGIGTTAPTQRLDVGGGNIAMGYEIISSTACNSSTAGWATCTATCSTGKQAMGGACIQGGAIYSGHYTDITSNSYTCAYYKTNVVTAYVAKVVCANIR